MTSFELISYPDIRNSLSVYSLFPHLSSNVRTKLKKYPTIIEFLIAIHEQKTTLTNDEETLAIDEILRIDRNLVNYQIGNLKNPKLSYISNKYEIESIVEENDFIFNELSRIKENTDDKFIIDTFNKLAKVNINLENVNYVFINAQLVNYLHSESSSYTNAKKLNITNVNKDLESLIKENYNLFMPVSSELKKENSSKFLDFTKNIIDNGITSTIHLITFSDETLKFIKTIEPKFIFKINRIIN
tara:strand:- start:561 stop:1292 length:732 start_codon:yes stop_codon:yes gene_type:complete